MPEQKTREIGFLDVLAWLHCPLAASKGYLPEHPVGDEQLALQILQGYPKNASLLERIVLKGLPAATWLARTVYGARKLVTPHVYDPPPVVAPRSSWAGSTGYLRLSDQVVLRFTVPYLYRLGEGGAWEIVVLDTNRRPPSEERYADLITYMGFLAECFQAMSGKRPLLRLVAPGYKWEETPELPEDSLLSVVRLLPMLGPLPFKRPSRLCRQTERREGGKADETVWRCPLREAGVCTPFDQRRETTGSRYGRTRGALPGGVRRPH
jgi:hypothetical protein